MSGGGMVYIDEWVCGHCGGPFAVNPGVEPNYCPHCGRENP